MNNKEWSDNILKKQDPAFRHRWEVFNDLVKNSLSSETVWIDCGCGDNGMITDFGKFAKTAVGIDVVENKSGNNYVRAEIGKMPFASGCADLITLRFVVEHFENIKENLLEINRVLKKNGKMIILTTNLLCPLIFLPRIILPYSLKSKILTKTFKVNDNDVFPTYHRLNTPNFYFRNPYGFNLKTINFISDLNYTRKSVFLLLLLWHKITDFKPFRKFRTNILVVLEKQ